MTAVLSSPPRIVVPWTRPDYDVAEIYTLVAMSRFPAVRELARMFGPAIFTPGAPQRLAKVIVTGKVFQSKTPQDLRLAEEVRTCRLENLDEPWGLHLVRMLAADRWQPLLVGQLEWAIRALQAGWPLKYARDRVVGAFAVAAGEVELTLGHWGDAT